MIKQNASEFDKETDFPSLVNKLRSAGCVFAEEEARLLISAAKTTQDLALLTEQRVSGFPLEHVIGWAEFYGLRIEVDPGVFVPRRRSEFLVRQAAALIHKGSIVVDLCCGSGAVGTALAASQEGIQLFSSDIDSKAVRCALRNVSPVGGNVYEGDLYKPLPAALRGRVNVLVANAPYVPSESINFLPSEARLYEDRLALDGGTDGLDIQRKITKEAPLWLASGGHLLIETSERQASLTAEIFSRNGLRSQIAHDDELDSTVVIGTKL